MSKGRWKFIIPTVVIVTIASIYMLTNYYKEVPTNHKVLIVICAAIFSGIISHGIFPNKDDEVPDEKPTIQSRTKK